MYFLRISSIIFALGMLVGKLFAIEALPANEPLEGAEIRTYEVQPFTKIHLEGGYKVILEQGTHPGLRIKTDIDNFQYIDVQSNAESLSLKISKKQFNLDQLVLYITFKELDQIVIQGGIGLETKGYVDLKDFYLRVEGGASIEMNMKARNVKVVGEGGVKFELDGIADELDATISGAGYLDAKDFKTRKTDCRIEGVGAAVVYATGSLYASIAGVGKIRYKGDPQVFKKVEGIGLVSRD